MKKIGVLYLLMLVLLSILFLNIFAVSIKAQLSDTGLPSGLEGDVEKIQNLTEKGQEIIEKTKEQESRDYLFQEWKKMFLGNKFVSVMDSFLTKISFVFVVLFGEPYSLSGMLLIMIILWFYLFLKFSEIFRNFTPFSEIISWIIGLGITIIMAQTQALRKITEWLVLLTFYKEGSWYRFFIIVGIIVALFLIYYFTSAFGKTFKEQKEKAEIEKEKAELKAGAKISRGMIEGTKNE